MRFLAVFSWLALCPLVLCDYRVEVQLIQYLNPMGLDTNGQCCDLDLGGGSCSTAETCDVEFLFRVQNIDTGMSFNSETKGVSRYNDRNQIDFGNCQELPSNVPGAVVTNPLSFIIPSDSWTGTDDRLRMTATIQDYDEGVGNSGPVLQSIAAPFLDITRPSSPSGTFSNMQAITSGPASISLKFRVICTDGTCGDDCSQTNGCPAWTPACDGTTPITTPPITTGITSPTNPCFPPPCRNGGTCIPTGIGVYRCDCAAGFDGDNCEIDLSVTTDPTATGSTQTVGTGSTVGPTDTTNPTVGGTGGGAVRSIASQWTVMLCALLLIVKVL